jgi:predicted Zn-dependent protease
VSKAPHYETKDSPEALADHAIMLAKLRGFMNYPIETYNQYPETDTSFPARYARAMAMYKDLETDKALAALDDLSKDQPTNPYVWELKGQVLFERGRTREAVEPLRKASQLAPNSSLIHASLGQALLAGRVKENAPEAINHLIRAVNAEPDNGSAWRFLADAYELGGNTAMASLATAEGNFFQGNMIDARNFARRAQDRLTKDTPEYRRATDIVNAAEMIVERSMQRGRGG